MDARHLISLGLLFAAVPLPGPATLVDAPDIDSLIRLSDYVVHAVVTSATPEWREQAGRRYISTRVVLEIREVIKGAPPSPLVLNLIGGRIGADELVVDGLPVFHAGDEQVLFVHSEQSNMLPLVALMHGVYPVIHEARTGEGYVMRSNGQPLYDAQDVSRPMSGLGAAKPQKPGTRPLTTAAFIRQIREHAAALPLRNEN